MSVRYGHRKPRTDHPAPPRDPVILRHPLRPTSLQPDRVRVPDYTASRSQVPVLPTPPSPDTTDTDPHSETLTLRTSTNLRTPIVVKTVHFAEQLETRYSLQSLYSDSSDPDYDDVPLDDNANEAFCDEDEETEVKRQFCDDSDCRGNSDNNDNVSDTGRPDVKEPINSSQAVSQSNMDNNNTSQSAENCNNTDTNMGDNRDDSVSSTPPNVISCPPVNVKKNAPLAEEEELSDASDSTLEADRPDDIPDSPELDEPESPQMGNGAISAKKLLQDAIINKKELLGTLRIPKPKEESLNSPKVVSPTAKPVVKNVKLVKHESLRQWESPRRSKSHEELDRLDLFVDMADIDVDYRGRAVRSSFLEEGAPERFSACLDLGDYQTILKHSRKGEEHIYSLPQPQCYGENTLKAVKQITEKYDTFRRRQITGMSFRDGEGKGRPGSPPINTTTQGPSDIILGPMGGVWIDPPEESDDTPSGAPQPVPADLTPQEVARIGLFYRGFGTHVVVCACYADLYMGTSVSQDNNPADWEHTHSGIPVFVLNTGNGKRPRELFVLLAEKETGFPIWQDKITYLSEYREVDPCIHTMHLSGSLSRVAKLRMKCEAAAQDFIHKFTEMTSDPDDDLWKVSIKDRSKKKKKKFKMKRTSKKEISHPCNFSHVTRIDPKDPTLESLAPPSQPPLPVDLLGDFRPRTHSQ